MKSVSTKSAGPLALALSLLLIIPSAVRAQDPQATPAPVDEKARQRAERDAKRAAEQEEKALRAAAEKERREAEAEAREREKATARLAELEKKGQDAGGVKKEPAPEKPAPSQEGLTREQQRIQEAEEKARTEAEKARKKEEDRARAQDSRDAERRRKDEERAGREALKARETEDRARAEALRKEQGEGDRPIRRPVEPATSAGVPAQTPPPARVDPSVPLSKDDDRKRRELVKQIEKARTERDRLNREAEEAERIARSARSTANEGQRAYEALTTGLDAEDVTMPAATLADEAPKKNRFMTKADEKQATAARNAPQVTVDPLRVALDLKNSDPEAREKAAFALASLGPDAQPATRSLMAALADANASVRVAAAQALGRIGPGASLAVAPLSAALTDPDPAVKNAAQAALIAIQGR